MAFGVGQFGDPCRSDVRRVGVRVDEKVRTRSGSKRDHRGPDVSGAAAAWRARVCRRGEPGGIRWTPTAALALLYLAVCGSITATWLNYWLLKRMDATKVLLMALAEPPIAMMLGAAILDETLSARTITGTICILVSVGVVLELFKSERYD